jgi:hypothetical protein
LRLETEGCSRGGAPAGGAPAGGGLERVGRCRRWRRRRAVVGVPAGSRRVRVRQRPRAALGGLLAWRARHGRGARATTRARERGTATMTATMGQSATLRYPASRNPMRAKRATPAPTTRTRGRSPWVVGEELGGSSGRRKTTGRHGGPRWERSSRRPSSSSPRRPRSSLASRTRCSSSRSPMTTWGFARCPLARGTPRFHTHAGEGVRQG